MCEKLHGMRLNAGGLETATSSRTRSSNSSTRAPSSDFVVGSKSRCRRRSNNANSSWRTVARPEWKRSEEHTSELQSLMRISYADFCLQKKKHNFTHTPYALPTELN